MYAIGSSARRGFASVNFTEVGRTPIYDDEFSIDHHAGFGVIPALVVSGGISLLGSLFRKHSGLTTHAQRFLAAQTAGDTVTAHTLIDQAYYHAFTQTLPDWMKVWQVMLNEATPANHQYMNSKMGIASNTPAAGGGGVPGSPNQPGSTGYHQPTMQSDLVATIFSPVGIAAALALYFAFGRKR